MRTHRRSLQSHTQGATNGGSTNVLDKARGLIEERLKEGIDDERKRLERALSNLKGDRRLG